MTENAAIKVLVVDDNAAYRQAFSRNLVVQGMHVVQAEDADQAMQMLEAQKPDVMVTDLQMRTETEGLDLIRNARSVDPILPIVMISAVGSFDEGAMASKLGAAHVLSKARIEEEIETLYRCIRESYEACRKNRAALAEIAEARERADVPEKADTAAVKLRAMLEDETLSNYVKGEAFEALTQLGEARQPVEAEGGPSAEDIEAIDAALSERIHDYAHLEPDTVGALRVAEYLYQRIETMNPQLEVSRSICFSYCFSVENQAKGALRKRIARFLSDEANFKFIQSLFEKKSTQIDMFFQQHLLQTIREGRIDFTIDNVRLTFNRILEHRVKYRPDGLKALGIILLTFGRTYEYPRFNKKVRVENPLGIRGVESNEDVARLAQLLISLQHFRNPYIHPEIHGKEALSAIRSTAIECLDCVMHLK